MTALRKKTSSVSNPKTQDQIRDLILDFLYAHHQRARGVRAQEMKIRDLQAKMKAEHGLSQQEVASNLDYLVQKQWVQEIRRERTFTTPGGAVIPREQITYKISDVGIDRVEGESRFKKQSPFGGINISNIQGVVVLGDRNVVKQEFEPLARQLEALESAISTSALPDPDKLAAIGDIETIKGQLAKPGPDHVIIRQAWNAVEKVVTAGGFAELLVKAGKLIVPLIS